MQNKIVVIDRTESFVESLFSDLVSFAFLAFCVWLSKGNTWWTSVTGTMFIVFCFGKIAMTLNSRKTEFKTKTDLLKWIETLDW